VSSFQRGSVSTYGRWFWIKINGGGLLIALAVEFIALWAGLGLVNASLIAFGVLELYLLPMIFRERRKRRGGGRRRSRITDPEPSG
jgi:hypothetical protein